jgi:hypothetical protein
VTFHDTTSAAIAELRLTTDAELDGVSGIGIKKREAHAADVLCILARELAQTCNTVIRVYCVASIYPKLGAANHCRSAFRNAVW